MWGCAALLKNVHFLLPLLVTWIFSEDEKLSNIQECGQWMLVDLTIGTTLEETYVKNVGNEPIVYLYLISFSILVQFLPEEYRIQFHGKNGRKSSIQVLIFISSSE